MEIPQSMSLFDETLDKYAKGRWYFIETGTNEGGGAIQASAHFSTVITIEKDPSIFFSNYKRLLHFHILPMLGDSPSMLELLLPHLFAPVIYLDAHTPEHNPLEEELYVIRSSGMKDIVLLIDDVRAMGTNTEHGPGWERVPLERVKEWCLAINPKFSFSFEDTRNGPGDLLVAMETK